MQTAVEKIAHGIIHKPVARHRGEAGEAGRGDAHPEMGAAPRRGAGVPRMSCAFVDHFETAGREKFRQPASRFALVGVFVAKTKAGVRVAVTGAGPGVFRSKELEAALGGNFSADAAKGVKISANGLNGDLHGSPEYRASLISTLAGRAAAGAS